LSIDAIVDLALAPSPTPPNFGAAVVANVPIIAVTTANSASELPLVLFSFFHKFLNIFVLLYLFD
jgi:hypothetical protein